MGVLLVQQAIPSTVRVFPKFAHDCVEPTILNEIGESIFSGVDNIEIRQSKDGPKYTILLDSHLFTRSEPCSLSTRTIQPEQIEERDRVENQLAEAFRTAGLGIDFDYQGSVTNDTHVRVFSDVDLLTVEKRWYGLQPPNVPFLAYPGDSIADLREIRQKTVDRLRSSFPKAKIDESKGKCINISGGSLSRDIDVVACARWHTVEYERMREQHWLGIEVLDNEAGARIPNMPFLHNKRISERDDETRGGLRKAVRLLKSLKYDSDEKIKVSSYDVASIAYNVPTESLTVPAGRDPLLVSNIHDYLNSLYYFDALRDSIEVAEAARKYTLRQLDITALNNSALERMLRGTITEDQYKNFVQPNERELKQIVGQLADVAKRSKTLEEVTKQVEAEAIDLAGTWLRASIEDKHAIQRALFGLHLAFHPIQGFLNSQNILLSERMVRFLVESTDDGDWVEKIDLFKLAPDEEENPVGVGDGD